MTNPYTYFPCVNLAMLGRGASDRRHSMAQLGGVLLDRTGDSIDGVFQMYSYRSLLLFKLVKEMPMPPRQGLWVARALMNAMAIFGIFLKDGQGTHKTMRIGPGDGSPLAFDHKLSPAEQAWKGGCEERLRAGLWKMRCIPMGKIHPGNAGSIHYAG